MRDWSVSPARLQHAPIPHCPPNQTVLACFITSNPDVVVRQSPDRQKPRVMNPGPLNEFWVEAALDTTNDREPLKRHRGESTYLELFAQSQSADRLTVTRNVVLAQVRKQAAPLTYHLQKPA